MLTDNIKKFFSLNKKEIFILVLFIIIYLFTGLFSAIKIGKEFTLYDLQNFLLKNFLLEKTSFLMFILLNIFLYFLLLIVICILSKFRITLFIVILFIGYLAFLLGIDSYIIISSIGIIKGFVICILFYVPCQIFILLINNLFCLRLFEIYKYSKNIKCIEKNNKIKLLTNFCIVAVLLIIVEGISLLITTKFFVFL